MPAGWGEEPKAGRGRRRGQPEGWRLPGCWASRPSDPQHDHNKPPPLLHSPPIGRSAAPPACCWMIAGGAGREWGTGDGGRGRGGAGAGADEGRPLAGWVGQRTPGRPGMETRGKKAAGPGCGASSISGNPGPFLRALPGRKQRQHKPGSHRHKPASHGGASLNDIGRPNSCAARRSPRRMSTFPAKRVPR